MLKKMGYFTLILFLLTIVANVILALLGKILPIGYIMPEGLVEPPKNYEFILGNFNFSINQTILNTWAIMAIIITILILGTKNLSVLNPSKLQIILEEYYQFIEKTFLETFGEHKKKYISFFAALFALIIFSNLSLFLFPFIVTITKGESGILEVHHFFRVPTADPNTTIGLALLVLVTTTIASIKTHGIKGYLKSYLEPMWFMLPLNIIEKISSVLNTSMRLFGNMLAGLVIGGLMYSLVGKNLLNSASQNLLNSPFSFAVGWPIILQLYLDLFEGVIQAFVFTVLSAVYVSEALGEE